MKREKIVLLIALLSIALFVQVILNAELRPLHLDEYDHLAIAKETVEEQAFVSYNPFPASGPEQGTAISALESSFDTLLAITLLIVPVQATSITMPFALFISIISALSALLLARNIFKSELAQFLVAVTVFFIQNNISPGGNVFAVPLHLGSALMLFAAYLFVKMVSEKPSKKYAALFFIVTINLLLVHPIFFLFTVLAATLTVLLHPNIATHNAWTIGFAAALAIIGIALVQAAPFLSLEKLIFWNYQHVKPFGFIGFITLPGIALALAGAITLAFGILKKRFTERQIDASVFILSAAAIGLALRVYGDVTGICLFGPCPRITSALNIFVFILIGIGVYAILSIALKRLNALPSNISKACSVLLVILVVVGAFNFIEYTAFTNRDIILNKYLRLDAGGERASLWLLENSEAEDKVFALPWDAKGVFVVSSRNTSPTITARLGSFLFENISKGGTLSDISVFFELNCNYKKKYLKKYATEWLYYQGEEYPPEEKVDCFGINKVFQGSYKNHAVYLFSEAVAQ